MTKRNDEHTAEFMIEEEAWFRKDTKEFECLVLQALADKETCVPQVSEELRPFLSYKAWRPCDEL